MDKAEYQKRYWQENKERLSILAKDYRDQNKDKELKRISDWRKRNKERIKDYNSIYCKTNLEKLVTATRNKRAKRRNVDGIHSIQDILILLEIQEHKCNGCFNTLDKYDVDHIIPLSKGGSNWPSNLQLLCPTCNRSKNDKTMQEWEQHKKRLSN